ncbi:hypothetical protein BGZ76_004633 [Entomortierella beljakovae]|nr:hypothetical protein BGZ76_004633 [Entomortierella beljakovae]
MSIAMLFKENEALIKILGTLGSSAIPFRRGTAAVIPISLAILKVVLACAPFALVSYMAAVRRRRYQGINKLLKKYPDPTLPLRDLEVANEIWSFVSDCEFPFMMGFGTQVSLMKTASFPSMSKIFVSTRQLTHHTEKRMEDTVSLLAEATQIYSRQVARSMARDEIDLATGKVTTTVLDPALRRDGEIDEEELLERANDEKRMEAAVDRINFFHSNYRILDEDFIYSMSSFAVQPTHFIDKFEWRKVTELEKNALFAVWSDLLRKMNLKDLPPTLEEFNVWIDAYVARKMKISPANNKLVRGSLSVPEAMVKSPRAKAFVRSFYVSLLDPKYIDAMELERPSWAMCCFSKSVLWIRGRIVKYFMFPRVVPNVITALRATKFEDVTLKEELPDAIQIRRGTILASESSSCPFTGGMRYVPRFFVYKNTNSRGYKVEELGPLSFFGRPEKIQSTVCPFANPDISPAV